MNNQSRQVSAAIDGSESEIFLVVTYNACISWYRCNENFPHGQPADAIFYRDHAVFAIFCDIWLSQKLF